MAPAATGVCAGVARNSAALSATAISGNGAACLAVGVVANVGEGREFDWAFDWAFECEFGGKKEMSSVVSRLSVEAFGPAPRNLRDN